MSLEIINIGTLPNDGEGDPLRTAFSKTNNNFASLYETAFLTTSTITYGNTAGQVILEAPTSSFTQGIFQIRSSQVGTPDSQDVTLSAMITNNLLDVKYSGFGMSFAGNAVTNYDMDVFESNVRILVNPIVNQTLNHFISAQVTFPEAADPGLDIQLDGYVDGIIMYTEDSNYLSTESQ